MNFKKHRQEEPSINLTSLIDIVFLLLIFFMVTTTFDKNNHVSLTLPEAESTQKLKEKNTILITVDSQGQYSLNKKNLTRNDAETLALAIESLEIEDKSTPVIISADALSSHQSVVTVMDVSARLGYSRVSIATTKQSGNSQGESIP